MGRQGLKALHFSASEEENETWVPLIEKAYAKVYGDYAALDGGRSTDALEDLTGGVSSYISVVDILDPETFWTKELIRVGEDRLFGCFIQGMNPTEQSERYRLVNGTWSYFRAMWLFDESFRTHLLSRVLGHCRYRGRRQEVRQASQPMGEDGVERTMVRRLQGVDDGVASPSARA
jgi:hypothetical protein